MGRVARITKEAIIEVAVELIRTEGHERLNVRALAERLGCSTQPILYHFASMEEVRAAAYHAVDERHSAFLVAGLDTASEPLLQLGLNYVRFAYEEPRLFRFLFQTDAFGGQDLGALVAAPEVAALVGMVAREAGLDEAGARSAFLTMFVCAHGYASLLANNALPFDEGEASRVLEASFLGACDQAASAASLQASHGRTEP